MRIEQFIAQNLGEWASMRSSHSLAFKQFEQVVSTLKIKLLKNNDSRVLELVKSHSPQDLNQVSPFSMEWRTESDWNTGDNSEGSFGSCILVPIPISNTEGLLLRSIGYAEKIKVVSNYEILQDGTFKLSSEYEHSISEERIWFLSENVRCRSTVLRTSQGKGILQTSFASEIRKMNL